jgi:RsiW-degrading membrane proteinase PrsW (M82 family)
MGRQFVAALVFLATGSVLAAVVPRSWPLPVLIVLSVLCLIPAVAVLVAFRARDRRNEPT